jgi:hypothetical protein
MSVTATAHPAVRGMWTLFEPVHALTYFAPQARAAFEDAGVRGFWRGYFAGRAAPLGAIGPAPVIALFHSFSPAIVNRALPAVWELVTPQRALELRAAGAAAALRALVPRDDPGAPDDPDGEVAALADGLWQVATTVECGGRALGAANAVQPRPHDPYATLWQATATLREHRGDGHIAALVCAGLTGLEAIVLRAGADLDRAVMQPGRGWADEEWARAVAGLHARGLVDAAGRATDDARSVLADVERTTDVAASGPWADLVADGGLRDLATRLLPIARACAAALPSFNPIGLQTPWDPAAPT